MNMCKTAGRVKPDKTSAGQDCNTSDNILGFIIKPGVLAPSGPIATWPFRPLAPILELAFALLDFGQGVTPVTGRSTSTFKL